MVCPYCGTTTAAPEGTCAKCGKGVPPRTVAVGTLTPPSPWPPTDPGATGLRDSGTGAAGGSNDQETRLGTAGGSFSPVAGQAAGPLAPGAPFGTRYRILRELGVGGMGVVYEAWDEELGLAVALKTIRPEVSADPTAARDLEARFKRELLLARQVTHRNVVRIHDIGEVGGTKYITMSFVDGRDLLTILQEAGHLPVSAALHLLRQVAAGLQAAHDAGVIHRDLKPANIMVEGDVPMIMDFGIARPTSRTMEAGSGSIDALARARSALVTGATLQGAVLGTLAYMAPEQAKAQEIDQRADLYALGMIARDMLLGLRQWDDPTGALTELKERMEHPPPSLRTVDASIPETVDLIVGRCLQPDPAARYQSVAELIADLDALDAEGKPLPRVHPLTKRLVVGSATLVLALLFGTWWLSYTPPPPPKREPVSVLIADFENRTGDLAFQGSVEQALATAMERASYVSLFARNDARAVASELRPSSAGGLSHDTGLLVARREGIKVLLSGAIEPRAGGFRVSVQATNPGDGKPITTVSEDVSGKSQVLFAVSKLAATVRVALGESAKEMANLSETFTAGSLEAIRAYARGQELLEGGNYVESLKPFQEAVSLDPEFGRAYALIGTVYTNLKQLDKADASFQQALKRLDRMTEREKYRTLAGYNLFVARNYKRAIENYEQLLERYPAEVPPYNNLSLAYLFDRNIPKALEMVRKGVEAAPKNLVRRSNYAYYAMYAAEFKTATAEAQRVVQENPSYDFAYLPLALSSLALGDVQNARDTYAKLHKVSATGASLARLGTADLEMYLGRYTAAVQILRAGIAADLRAKNSGMAASKHVALAEALLALGERRQAAAAALKAASLSDHESVLFPAAKVLVESGQAQAASKIEADLDNKLQVQTTSYARLIAGARALQAKQWRDALDALLDAQKRDRSWFAHYLSGRVYSEAGLATEALQEFDQCLKRRGEATDVFFYDTPTLRYLPPLYYWAARAQEAVGAAASALANYEQFVKIRSGATPPDPLVADARKRIGG